MNNISEFEKAVLEEIDNIAIKQVIHGKPLFELEDILLNKTITNLREIGRINKIRRYTKMNKNELVSNLVKEISDIEYLQEMLMIIDSAAFEEFCIAAKSPQYICTGVTCAKLHVLKAFLIVELYYFGNNFIAVVPTEIKNNFNTLVANGFIERKKRSDLIHDYATAAINLYGVISQEDFVNLFNSQNKKKTDIDEVFQTLLPHIIIDSNYCFWQEYLVCADFEDSDFKDVSYLLNSIGNKPRYIPNKQELLKYTDGEYYEETPQTRHLLRCLQSITDDPDQAEDMAHELCVACFNDSVISDMSDIINANFAHLKDHTEIRKITEALTDVSNNTRTWSNNGHTANEIFSKFTSPNLFPIKNTIKPPIISRNGPCPCGSGKKYKRCCGK